MKWSISLGLKNIYLESNEIKIDHDALLRRPTKEELSIVKQKHEVISEWDPITGKKLLSGAILSFITEVVKESTKPCPEKIPLQIQNWLNHLRLFNPSNVSISYQSIKPESILEYPIEETIESPSRSIIHEKVNHKDTSNYQLIIKRDEESLLESFIDSTKPFLKHYSRDSYLSGDALNLAINRYNDALSNNELNAYKILSAISSLEALLGDSGGEIAFKIRIRSAKILSLVGLNGLDVENKIKEAYTLRSKLVHGSKLNQNLLEFARKNTYEVLNFTRICLLIFLKYKYNNFTENLVNLIDESLIDKTKDEYLAQLINQNVRIP